MFFYKDRQEFYRLINFHLNGKINTAKRSTQLSILVIPFLNK